MGGGDFCGGSDEDWALVFWDVVAAVGAFDEGCIERDDFQQAAEAELFFQEKFCNFEFWEGDGGVEK